jgi:hypothetical protein
MFFLPYVEGAALEGSSPECPWPVPSVTVSLSLAYFRLKETVPGDLFIYSVCSHEWTYA